MTYRSRSGFPLLVEGGNEEATGRAASVDQTIILGEVLHTKTYGRCGLHEDISRPMKERDGTDPDSIRHLV